MLGSGWVAVVGIMGDSKVGCGGETAERTQQLTLPLPPGFCLPVVFRETSVPTDPAPETRNFV